MQPISRRTFAALASLHGWNCAGLQTPPRRTVCRIDFDRRLRPWDGFGVNYVEAAQSPDYDEWPQDYGGFSILDARRRESVLDAIFGPQGLRPGVVKMFLDPLHQEKPGGPFQHERTTRQMRGFVREGLRRTRDGGGDFEIATTAYGAPAWTNRLGLLKARNVDPDRLPDLAAYMVDWVRYLREEERFPVTALSLHNEGEKDHWQGRPEPLALRHDYLTYWPPRQIAAMLPLVRRQLDAQGLSAVRATPGESRNWNECIPICDAILEDAEATRAMGLLTSHGFGEHFTAVAATRMRSRIPGLRAWTLSFSWRNMDAAFVDQIVRKLYANEVNSMTPWAVIQRPTQWHGGDGNPGSAFHVGEDGSVKTTMGYYFYKQATTAGIRGCTVVDASSNDPSIAVLAFAKDGTTPHRAVLVVNAGEAPREVHLELAGLDAGELAHWRTSPGERFVDAGRVRYRGGLDYTCPPGSVTTWRVLT